MIIPNILDLGITPISILKLECYEHWTSPKEVLYNVGFAKKAFATSFQSKYLIENVCFTALRFQTIFDY